MKSYSSIYDDYFVFLAETCHPVDWLLKLTFLLVSLCFSDTCKFNRYHFRLASLVNLIH